MGCAPAARFRIDGSGGEIIAKYYKPPFPERNGNNCAVRDDCLSAGNR